VASTGAQRDDAHVDDALMDHYPMDDTSEKTSANEEYIHEGGDKLCFSL
jgi:hypothetical protein